MNIIRAQTLGFCMGVKQAVDRACEEHPTRKVYTLGSLIHNPQALNDLKRRGIEILDADHLPADLSDATVIIRAHGISPHGEAALRGRGARIVDATCPRVKASQLKAASLAGDGYRLFLAGEERHAEITGIRGYAAAGAESSDAVSSCAVVGSIAEARHAAAALYAEDRRARAALIGQTTISPQEYHAIGAAIQDLFPALAIIQTICAATIERQESLRALLGAVDAVIIAGGAESANTRRLYAIAENSGKPCALAETQADIPPAFFAFQTIGLASGASTPDSVIDAIEAHITAFSRPAP